MQIAKFLPYIIALPLLAADPHSAITGIWRAQMEDRPAFVMKVIDDAGTLSGAVLFYMIDSTPGNAKQSKPGIPEPLLRVKFDGKALDFVVVPGSGVAASGPVKFQLRLVSKNAAVLIRDGDESEPFQIRRDE